MEADFSGYATKAGLKCSDGLTIMPNAFEHQDKMRVPLVWAHTHNDPENVLGHAVLENRTDGVYAYGFFNETNKGQSAKTLVQHGDIDSMSIWANDLVKKVKQVFHGSIKEVSLCLSGANPGAKIDFVRIAHSSDPEDFTELDTEAVIYTGLTLEHENLTEELVEHASDDGDSEEVTVQELYDSMTDDQKNLVEHMVAVALKTPKEAVVVEAAEHSEEPKTEGDITHQEGNEEMTQTRNVFEKPEDGKEPPKTLSHSDIEHIFEEAKKPGMTLKEAVLAHVVDYGIENIDYLFPDAKNVMDSPEFVKRRTEWVSTVINGTRHSPFSRIKSMSADITHEEARAKGYVKGNLKKEEFFALSRRTTTPTTIYKKQKLDRDDIVDITDMDVVAWLKAEMRVMLDEEIARAVLVGDGREVDDDDKINESNIRPIAHDDDFYAHKVTVATNTSATDMLEAILRARTNYRGSGNPTMFCTEDLLTDMLLTKDTLNRRFYSTASDVAAALRVSAIVPVEVMEDQETDDGDLLAILVNLNDYTLGADKGGGIALFDDFDIDYNQYKYLMETRLSGALTKYKTALVVSRTAGTEATPTVPTFNATTGVVTIPTVTGVVYKNGGTGATLTAGAQTAIASGATIEIEAVPASGYHFPHNFDADWEFTRD